MVNIFDDWIGIDDSGGLSFRGGSAPAPKDQNPDPSSLEAPQIDYAAMTKAQVDAMKQISAFNQEQFPGLVTKATSQATSFADTLNPQLKASFYNALEFVLPNWRHEIIGTTQDVMSKTKSYAEELMSGTIAPDTLKAMNQALGESGQKGGNWNSNRLARATLDQVTANREKGLQLYGTLTALSSDLLGKTKTLTAPTIDVGSTAWNMLNMLGTSSMGSSNTAQQGVIQGAQSNADLAWSGTLSKFNAQLDMTQYDQYISQMKSAEKYQKIGAWAGFFNGLGRL